MSAPTVQRAGSTEPTGPTVPALRPLPPRRRPRRWLRLLAVVVAVAVAAGAVWLVWFSSVLSVREVRVVGVDDAGYAKQVLRAAAVPVGVPLARLDTAAAQQRVLQLDWVRTADVRRGWPAEAVVAVEPRLPIAQVSGSGTERLLVDGEGVAFAPVAAVPKGLPIVDADGDGLVAAMGVLAALPPDLARKVVSLSASTRDDVVLTLRSGDRVRWGSAEDPERKAEVLRALLTRKADVYDVSAPELPTTFRAR